jgi:hypothetical protein
VTEQPKPERFWVYAALAAGVAAAGFAAAALLPHTAEGRLAALVGVGAAALSGVVALPLKRRAVAVSMKAALMAMSAVFGVRVVLVAVGLVWVLDQSGQAIAFTLGFFGVYLVLQWVEISYVVAERNRRGPSV